MAQIAIGSFRSIVDRMAQIAATTESDFGTADAPGTPIDQSDAAQSILDLLEALTDGDVLADLIRPAQGFASSMLGVNMRGLVGVNFADLLAQHVGGFAAYLIANADGQSNVEQVPEEFRDAFGQASAEYVFSPAVSAGNALGLFEATGAEAGTFTDGVAIDPTQYGNADIEAEVVNQAIGASEITVTVTGTAWGGVAGAVSRTITITAAANVGVKFTAAAGAHIVDVTNISVTGATSGDDFKINAILKRTIAFDA